MKRDAATIFPSMVGLIKKRYASKMHAIATEKGARYCRQISSSSSSSSAAALVAERTLQVSRLEPNCPSLRVLHQGLRALTVELYCKTDTANDYQLMLNDS